MMQCGIRMTNLVGKRHIYCLSRLRSVHQAISGINLQNSVVNNEVDRPFSTLISYELLD